MEMRMLVNEAARPAQEIISDTCSPVHVQRWTIFRSKFFDVAWIIAPANMKTMIDAVNRTVSSQMDWGGAHTPDDTQTIASFDDKAWMVLVRRHSVSERQKVT